MVGRKKEFSVLEDACNLKSSSLISIYGRRRIGKTYLVNQMFMSHKTDCMFFSFTGASDLNMSQQIANFVEAVYDWFKVEPQKDLKTWTDAFIFLKRTISEAIDKSNHEQKVVLFFDEVPWVDKKNKDGFLSALGHFWNTYCEVQNNFMVILCGSNASWIKSKILEDSKGPLYKRVTEIIEMHPFDLKETKEYLLSEVELDVDDRTAVEYYMIYGGVAKYLSYLKKNESVAESVDRLFFSLSGNLYDEFDMVFKSLFYGKHGGHKKIIDLLCDKRTGFTQHEIEEKTGLSYPTIKSALDELSECGFTKGMNKLGNRVKGTKYVVVDSLCLFHTKWIKELNKNDIANISGPYWSKIMASHQYPIWAGFAFESVVINNVHLYASERGLLGALKGAYYWQYTDSNNSGNGAQIDMVVEYDNNVFDIVEMKYWDDVYTISSQYANNLINKRTQFRNHGLKNKKSDIKLVMLTTFGCKRNGGYSKANVTIDVKLEDLLQ